MVDNARVNRGDDPRRVEGKLLVRVVRNKVKPEKREEFLETVSALVEPTRAEPGCISYEFYIDRSDENRVFFFEEWEDQAALEFHHNQPYTKAYLEKAASFPAETLLAYSYTASSFDVLAVEPEEG